MFLFRGLGNTSKELEKPESLSTRVTERRGHDMRFWSFAYGYTPQEYISCGFRNKSFEERRTFLSEQEGQVIAWKLNEIEALRLFFDKYRTYQTFQSAYRRDAIFIHSQEDYNGFCSFIEKHPIFVKKPIRESGGHGIELTDSKMMDRQELFSKLLIENTLILEEPIIQSSALRRINASTVNTVRCQTIGTKDGVSVIWCFGKLGRAGSFVDNGAAGGILAGIDIQTGVINTDGIDEYGKVYTSHPDSGCPIKGFCYPDWQELTALCIKLSSEKPEAAWIGWDLAHTDNGWIIVEGNSMTDVIGPQATSQTGIRKEIEKVLRKAKRIA